MNKRFRGFWTVLFFSTIGLFGGVGAGDQLASEAEPKLVLGDRSVVELMEMGSAFFESGKFAEAFEVYDIVVAREAANRQAWNRRGLAALNLFQYEMAVHSLEKAVQEMPINGFYYESLAWAYWCLGDYTRAVEQARTATLMYQREGRFSLYPLLISYFAYERLGDSRRATASLNYARRNLSSQDWPFMVLNFLSGEANQRELLASVSSVQEETEAHVYIGLKLKLMGNPSGARHLQWAAQRGDRSVFESVLAHSLVEKSGSEPSDKAKAAKL